MTEIHGRVEEDVIFMVAEGSFFAGRSLFHQFVILSWKGHRKEEHSNTGFAQFQATWMEIISDKKKSPNWFPHLKKTLHSLGPLS